jgi:large repetitive protein
MYSDRWLLGLVLAGCMGAPPDSPNSGPTVPVGVWDQIDQDLLRPRALSEGGWRVLHRRQGLRSEFRPEGLAQFSRPAGTELGLRLVGFGRTLSSAPERVGAPEADGSQIRFAWQGLTEHYTVHPDGMEHGFTVHERPDGAGPLTLNLGIEGDMVARSTPDGVRFDGARPADAIAYTDLRAWDAGGTALHAEMALTCEASCVVSLVVHDDDAAYPLTIDPLVAAAPIDLMAAGYPETFGSAVALHGNVLVVGVPDPDAGAGTAYVFQRHLHGADSWSEQQVLSSPGDGVNYGAAVATDGSLILVGAPGDAAARGRVVLYANDGTWNKEDTFSPAESEPGERFGAAVAVQGLVAAIGSPGDDGGAGSLLLFRRDGGAWLKGDHQRLSDAAPTDALGTSLAIARDRIVVGAPGRDDGKGQVFVLRDADDYALAVAEPFPLSTPYPEAALGTSVATDGVRIVVGAPGAGRAYVYDRKSTSRWLETGVLTQPDPVEEAAFGRHVALWGDTVAVNAADSLAHKNSTYLFAADHPTEGAWGHAQVLTHTLPIEALALSDDLLISATLGSVEVHGRPTDGLLAAEPLDLSPAAPTALALDGATLAVGVADDNAVYVFERNGADPAGYVFAAALTHPGMVMLGQSVAVQHNQIVAGAPGAPGDDSVGWVAVFDRPGAGSWSDAGSADTVLSGPDRKSRFGTAVALHGNVLLVGAPTPGGEGSVHTFLDQGGWVDDAVIVSDPVFDKGKFGQSLAYDGRTLVVGAPKAEAGFFGVSEAGTALVFRRNGDGWQQDQDLGMKSAPVTGANYGNAVAVQDDVIVVGIEKFPILAEAPLGAIQVFQRDPLDPASFLANTDTMFLAGGRYDASLDAGLVELNGDFGHAVATDGERIYVGEPRFYGTGGQVHTLERVGEGFELTELRRADGLTPFGAALALWDDRLLIADGPLVHNLERTPLPSVSALDDAASGTEDADDILVDILANDASVAIDDLTIAFVGGLLGDCGPPEAACGGLSIEPDGSVRFDPAEHVNGAITFGYRIEDAADGTVSDDAMVHVTVLPTEDPPQVADDHGYETPEDEVLVVGLVDSLLANDSDPDGDVLSISAWSTPASGTLAVEVDGTFRYTPAPDENGPVRFKYSATDGTTPVEGDATITITPVNDPPFFVGVSEHTIAEGDTLTVDLESLADDIDDADADLAFSIKAGSLVPTGHPAHPTIPPDALEGPRIVGHTLGYEPAADYFGSFQITLVVTDPTGESAEHLHTIHVTNVPDAPVAVDDPDSGEPYRTLEDTPLAIVDLLDNDHDADGTTPSLLSFDAPEHGSVVLVDDTMTYEPHADSSGPDSFQYKVTDGELASGWGTVSILVEAVDDPPVGIPDAAVTLEGELLDVSAPGVLSNDSDPDSEVLTAGLIAGPTHAETFSLEASGAFTYLPEVHFNGLDGFTYTVTADGKTSAPVAVTITVGGVASKPVALADHFDAVEDTPLTVPGATGVLANDTDFDGGGLIAELVGEEPRGTVGLSEDGGFTYTPEADFHGVDTFSYKAIGKEGALESDVALVTLIVAAVNDAPIAELYEQAIDETTPEASPAPPGLSATDVDGDALTYHMVGPIEVTGRTDEPAPTLEIDTDGALLLTRHEHFNGTLSFHWYARDEGEGELATGDPAVGHLATLSVEPTNDAPLAESSAEEVLEGESSGFDLLATDPDLDDPEPTEVLSFELGVPTVLDNPLGLEGPSFVVEGATVTLTPTDVDFHGIVELAWTVTDAAGEQAEGVVSLTTTPVNDAPTAVADAYEVAEDDSLTVFEVEGVLHNDTDVDGDPLTMVLVDAPTSGTLELDEDLKGGFSYTPDGDFSGADTFTYRAHDGVVASAEVGTVTITVHPLNDIPVLEHVLELRYWKEDEPESVADDALLGKLHATDPDGDVLEFSIVCAFAVSLAGLEPSCDALADPSPGALEVDASTGELMWGPALHATGQYLFQWTVQDGSGDEMPSAWSGVHISNSDDDPELSFDGPWTWLEDEAVADHSFAVHWVEHDGDPIAFGEPAISAVEPAGSDVGSVTINEAGHVHWVPAEDFHGSFTLTVLAEDDEFRDIPYPAVPVEDPVSLDIPVVVMPTPDAPVFTSCSFGPWEEGSTDDALAPVFATADDVDGDPLEFELIPVFTPDAAVAGVPDSEGGDVWVSADGEVTWELDQHFFGTIDLALVAREADPDQRTVDAECLSDTVVVPNTPDAPTVQDDTYYAIEDTLDTLYRSREDADARVAPWVDPRLSDNDFDGDGDPLSYSLSSDDAVADVTVHGDGSFTVSAPDNHVAAVVFEAMVHDDPAEEGPISTANLIIVPVNDPPTAGSPTFEVDEDTELHISLVALREGAEDVESETADLVPSLLGAPALGELVPGEGDEDWVFTPAADDDTDVSFTFVLTDPHGGVSEPGTATIAVLAVNDPPALRDPDATFRVTEDTPDVLSTDVTALFADPDALQAAGDVVLTVTLQDAEAGTLLIYDEAGAAAGFLTLAEDRLSWAPETDFRGHASFTLAVQDTWVAEHDIAEAAFAFTLEVEDAPDAPRLLDGAATTFDLDEDSGPLVVNLADMVWDPDGDEGSFALVAGELCAATPCASLDGAHLSFSPPEHYNHPGHNLSLTVSDGDPLSDDLSLFLTITVHPVDDAPSWLAPLAHSEARDEVEELTDHLIDLSGLLDEVDGDAVTLGVTLTGLVEAHPDHDLESLELLLVGGPGRATLSFHQPPQFFGTLTAEIEAIDDTETGLISPAPLELTVVVANVPDAPDAGADYVAVGEEGDVCITWSHLLENDADKDGHPEALLVSRAPPPVTTEGVVLSVDIPGCEDGFHYGYDPDSLVSDAFTYQVCDETERCDTALVTIENDGGVNDPPRVGDLSVLPWASVEHPEADRPVLVLGPLVEDTSPPMERDLTTVFFDPDFGVHGDGGEGALSFVLLEEPPVEETPDLVDPEWETPAAEPLALAGDGTLTYAPHEHFCGWTTATLQVTDATGISMVHDLRIDVTCTNDLPEPEDDLDHVTPEGVDLVVATAALLANDRDPDGDMLTFLLEDGVLDGETVTFEVPDEVAVPTHRLFAYKACDAVGCTSAEVAVTVTPENDAPFAHPDGLDASGEVEASHTVLEDGELVVEAPDGVLANDTDADGDLLEAVVAEAPAHGGLDLRPDGGFTYSPHAGYSGDDGFTYRAHDGAAYSEAARVTLRVDPVDDAPVARDDATSTPEDVLLSVDPDEGVLANDTNDGPGGLDALPADTLYAHPVSDAEWVGIATLELHTDGGFALTPEPDFHGLATFFYLACQSEVLDADSVCSERAEVTITVESVDDAPVAVEDAYHGAAEWEALALDITANDHDPDGDALTVVLDSTPSAGLLVEAEEPAGTWLYTPDATFAGEDSFTYHVQDETGLLSNTVTVTLTGLATPDLPVAGPDGPYRVDEDTILEVDEDGLLANDTDADGDPLTAVLVDPPGHGDLELDGSGTFLYTPDLDWFGTDSFSYQAVAVDGASAVVEVEIGVDNLNDRPTAFDDAYRVDVSPFTAFAFEGVLANDIDADILIDPAADELSASIDTQPEFGWVELQPDGGFVYTFTASAAVEEDSFLYAVTDLWGEEATALVTLRIGVQPSETTPGTETTTTTEDTEECEKITFYPDLDGDGYGDTKLSKLDCEVPDGHVTVRGDCADKNDGIHPGVRETPNDGIDQDCDGSDTHIFAPGTCDTGGGTQGWPLLGLMVALLRRRKRWAHSPE